MFNPHVIKKLRKEQLVLSDGSRQESQLVHHSKLVRFFSNLQSYYTVKTYHRGEARRHAKPIRKIITQQLVSQTDQSLKKSFKNAVQGLLDNQNFSHNLYKVFACMGEAIKRKFGFYPHDVQYLGAYILLNGQLAEMQTGEGKTIVAGMAATCIAGTGASVHVLSTNEYLATRDQEEMQVLFDFFEISSGSIDSEMEIEDRQQQYAKSICYVSASELVFDVLKDELSSDNKLTRHQLSLRQYLQNKNTQNSNLIVPALHFCIVDEADSVLIDEASTPLIISQEAESIIDDDVLIWALVEADKLKKDEDFKIDLVNREIDLLTDFQVKIDPPKKTIKPMWKTYAWQKLIIKKALTAIHLFHLDEHYILLEDKVVIVDESTGRPMPDRSWEQGLHQLIEIKEGLEVSETRQTIAQMTFQRFFRRYILLSGLTGTVKEVSREMWNVYGLKVCIVPPNRKNRRKLLSRQCFISESDKWQAVAKDALKVARNGQPVLIGTRSVEASETIMRTLQALDEKFNTEAGVKLCLLNARQNEAEADIVAKAGVSGTITIATNMAGRGTDIKLDSKAKEQGGLHVILTEHHESKRIDRQLVGRSARQGDVGSYREIVCFRDSILHSNKNIWQVLAFVIPISLLQNRLYALAIKTAQKRAQDRQYEIRMNTLKQDRNRQKQIGFIGKLE